MASNVVADRLRLNLSTRLQSLAISGLLILVAAGTRSTLMDALILNIGVGHVMHVMSTVGGDPLMVDNACDCESPCSDQAITRSLMWVEALRQARGSYPALAGEIDWYLARSLYLRGDCLNALKSLLSYNESHPEELGALPALSRLYDRISTLRFDDVRAEWSELPYAVIRPQESKEYQLELPAERPRILRVHYHDHADKVLSVSVSGFLWHHIRGQGLGWQMYEVSVPAGVADVVPVTLVNPTDNQEVAIHQLSLQYLPTARKFDDAEATWSEKAFKPLAPGQTYETGLYLPAVGSRFLKIEYYEYPAQRLTVAIEGVNAGEAESSIGGWREANWLVPHSTGDIVHISLLNDSSDGSALVSRMQLIYSP